MSENSPVGYPHHRCQKLCIEKIDSRKVTVLSSSTYEPDKNQGSIVLNFIKDADSLDSRVPTGFSESLQAKKSILSFMVKLTWDAHQPKKTSCPKSNLKVNARKRRGN